MHARCLDEINSELKKLPGTDKNPRFIHIYTNTIKRKLQKYHEVSLIEVIV